MQVEIRPITCMIASANNADVPSTGASTSNSLDKVSITSKCLACAPVTALHFLSSSSNLLLAAQGPLLKLYDVHIPKRPITELKLWSFQRIHAIVRGISRQDDGMEAVERLIVFGGKQVAIVSHDREKLSLSVESTWVADDWILAACWLGSQTILLLTSHNTLLRYEISSQAILSPRLTSELHCHERPLLWSACFSKSFYENERDVYVAVGTIMNEILVWRPFVEQGRIERRLIGHHGSVFFVTFSPDLGHENGYSLASGSDDRDVRLWDWKAGVDDHTSVILRGHTHRPWKATFCKASKVLITVGEDLRCLLWRLDNVTSASTLAPVGQYKGHEGKNIWAVAVSEELDVIATGGSDGAVRLWPLNREKDGKAIFTAESKDLIVAFDVTEEHVVFLTRKGNVYRCRTGDALEAPRHLFRVHSNKRGLQAEISIQGDSVWVYTREGRVYSMQIDDADSLQEQDIDCVPVIACGRKQGRQWALYDLRTRTVQVFRSDDSRLLTLVARRNPLEREKLPKFMTWLDDSSLVLADAIASLWVFDLRLEEGIIDIVYRGRLACKGTFALQSNVRKPGSFWVGTNGGSMSYRLLRQGSETRLELSGTDCLHYGVVREVHAGPSRKGLFYLACDNTSGRVVDEAGNILASVHCPASSAQTLRISVQGNKLSFYSNTGTRLHFQTYNLAIPPILQEGLQGREMWSVDLCRLEYSGRVLCATSAEDNTVKISEWHDGEKGSFQSVFRFPEPDGTLQNVRWSSASSEGPVEAVMLFATAAKERLFALRITFSSTEVTPTVVKMSEAPRSPDQVDDSRTMTLDVLKLPRSTIHAVLAGSSDGSLKLWHFDESTDEFMIRWSSDWHDRCLLSSRLVYNSGRLWAVSGATDGRLAIWNLEDDLEKPACIVDAVHQSGVNCLDAFADDKGLLHIASGGDDCSCAYITVSLRESAMRISSVTKADAHSSSLKGISILAPYSVVTTSTDQRLTCWHMSQADREGNCIQRVASSVTSVVDVADMAVLSERNGSGQALVAVCGIGLELLQTSSLP